MNEFELLLEECCTKMFGENYLAKLLTGLQIQEEEKIEDLMDHIMKVLSQLVVFSQVTKGKYPMINTPDGMMPVFDYPDWSELYNVRLQQSIEMVNKAKEEIVREVL